MARMASAKPTWASAGVAMRSPTAYTPGSAVRHQLVDLDEAALVDLDRGAVEAEGLGERPAADRRPPRSGRRSTRRRRTAPWCRRRGRGAVAGDGHAGADVDAPLLERPEHDPGDVVVAAGQDLGQRLEDRDLGAEVGHHRGELAADGAAADDHGRRRAAAASESSSSEVTTRVPSTSKPGMVRGTEPEARITWVAGELDVARLAAGDRARCGRRASVPMPSKTVTLRLLSRPDEAVGQLVDDLLLAGLGDGEVERRARRSSTPKSPASRDRRGARRPSRAAPWPGCSRRAGRCRRPCAFSTRAMLSPADAP